MKVSELLEVLTSADPEAEVILQKDAEGNSYSPLMGADHEAVYIPVTTWSGEVFSLKWGADDACMSEEEWELVKARPKCLVLFPIN